MRKGKDPVSVPGRAQKITHIQTPNNAVKYLTYLFDFLSFYKNINLKKFFYLLHFCVQNEQHPGVPAGGRLLLGRAAHPAAAGAPYGGISSSRRPTGVTGGGRRCRPWVVIDIGVPPSPAGHSCPAVPVHAAWPAQPRHTSPALQVGGLVLFGLDWFLVWFCLVWFALVWLRWSGQLSQGTPVQLSRWGCLVWFGLVWFS
jgi:hypothetical protein